MLYCANSADEFIFKDIFKQAGVNGLATNYLNTSVTPISAPIITKAVPDYSERLFYISGPLGFVKAARQALIGLGVKPTKIKSDYFPGYG